jgi:Ku70/Ku80 beta-barrel domain
MRSWSHRDCEHPYDRDRQLCAALAPRSALVRHSLYIRPSELVGHEAFAVIREAMRGKSMVALGRLVLSKRERMIALVLRQGAARHAAAPSL